MKKKNVICFNCRERVGVIDLEKAGLPLRGDMFTPHPGCEHWPLPLPSNGPLDFICPHAAVDGGDSHLFLPIREGRHEDACELMGEDHQIFLVGNFVGECPCGCGELVRSGNKYADNLHCYRRALAKLKSEIESNGDGDGQEDS